MNTEIVKNKTFYIGVHLILGDSEQNYNIKKIKNFFPYLVFLD